MSPNNLPANKNPTSEAASYVPENQLPGDPHYNLDGDHIMMYESDVVHIAPIHSKDKEIIRRGDWNTMDKVETGVLGAVFLDLGGITVYDLVADIPSTGHVANSLVAAGVAFGTFGRAFYRNRKERKRVAKVLAGIPQAEDTLSLPRRAIAFSLPQHALDSEIVFPSEHIVSRQPMKELSKAIQTFPGFSIQSVEERVEGQIEPWRMFCGTVNLFEDQTTRNRVIHETGAGFRAIHQAAQALPAKGISSQLPESIRDAHRLDLEQLVMGAFRVFGTVRAEYSPIIAEEAKRFYASREQECEDVLQQAVQLGTPTGHNISWSQITTFRDALAAVRS